MAHEIRQNEDGNYDFAYRQSEGLPWHGLGTPLPDDAGFDVWCKSAGFDHYIDRGIVRYATAPTTPQTTVLDLKRMNDRHVLFRSDNKHPISVVSDSYKVVQPRAVLEFFRDLVGAGGFSLSTAGVLFDGARYFCTAKITDDWILPGQDKVGGYLALWSSADGSLKTTAKVVATRIVCNNTLAVARGESSANVVRVPHSTKFDASKVKETLGVAAKSFREFMADMETLADTAMGDRAAHDFVAELVKDVIMSDTSTRDVRNTSAYKGIVKRINYSPGARLKSALGTAWGVLNGVTYYADHDARAKSNAHRVVNATFGGSADLKNEARKRLVALAA